MPDDNREILKTMLNNLINDKPEEATLDIHNYFVNRMKSVAGIGAAEEEVPEVEDLPVEDDSTTVETDPE